jgi:putative ABC transport system ATP-binding protein
MLVIRHLRFAWPGARRAVLDIPSLEVADGERLFLHGGSGSGKSTLFAAIAGVVEIAPGTLRIAGTDLGALRGTERDRFRAEHLGIVFQLFNLVPYLSALDNVLLPCRFSRARRERAAADPGGTQGAAQRLLEHLGLGDRSMLEARADQLSVGQQQRVAAARALIGAPGLVLADEPTSALDADLKDDFIDLLLAECRAAGSTLLFVSHDRGLEPHFDRAVDFVGLNRAAAKSAPAC